MTGEIFPCATTPVIDPRDPGRRDQQQGQPRRHHPATPPARPNATDAEIPDPPDPLNPPHIGTRIDVRV